MNAIRVSGPPAVVPSPKVPLARALQRSGPGCVPPSNRGPVRQPAPSSHFLRMCRSPSFTPTDWAGRRIQSAGYTITDMRTDISHQWLPERGSWEQIEDDYAYYIFSPNIPASVGLVAGRMRWLFRADYLPFVPHHSERTLRALDRLYGAVRVLSQRMDKIDWPLLDGVRRHLEVFHTTLNTLKRWENGAWRPHLSVVHHSFQSITSFIHSQRRKRSHNHHRTMSERTLKLTRRYHSGMLQSLRISRRRRLLRPMPPRMLS